MHRRIWMAVQTVDISCLRCLKLNFGDARTHMHTHTWVQMPAHMYMITVHKSMEHLKFVILHRLHPLPSFMSFLHLQLLVKFWWYIDILWCLQKCVGNIDVWDLAFSQQCHWRFKSSWCTPGTIFNTAQRIPPYCFSPQTMWCDTIYLWHRH